MELAQFLKDLDIEATDEEINAFIYDKDHEIKEHIKTLWFEYFPNKKQFEIVRNGEDTDQIDTAPEVDNNTSEITNQIDNSTVEEELMAKTESEEKRESEVFAIQVKNKNIIFPNGKVGIAYNYGFDIKKLDIPEIGEFSFEGLEAIGLTYDKESSSIKGFPKVHGEHSVTFKCRRKESAAGQPEVFRVFTIIINPDPKSLWNNLESDKNDPYWKPDCRSEFVKVPATGLLIKTDRKDMVAASQRGRSHAHEGKFRDDDFGLSYNASNQWYILTVADGAGSAKYSRKGSEIASQIIIDICKNELHATHKDLEILIAHYQKDPSQDKRKQLGDKIYTLVGGAVFNAKKRIDEEAVANGAAIKDYSTTLLLSICKKFKFGWFVAAFWVGDGGIGIYNKDERFVKILGEPDGGEFAGQTRFLNMPEITQPAELYRRLRFEIVSDFTALVLMTDGITDPKFETDANLMRIEKWDQLWDDLNKEVVFDEKNSKIDAQLLSWLDFWSPGNHDDRTIAILF